jgi:hypothetical protein
VEPKVAMRSFYATQILPEAGARRDPIIAGSDAMLMLEPEPFSLGVPDCNMI